MKKTPESHGLYRKVNRGVLWKVLPVILLLLLLPEFFIHHHPYFESQGFHLDGRFGFYAWYGFIALAVLLLLAKALGLVLQRKDSYYDE